MNTQTKNNTGLQFHPEQESPENNLQPQHPHPSLATPSSRTWRGVFFEGPHSDQDQEGEEIPVWYVWVGDAEANPIGKVYKVHSYTYAASLARCISRERRLDLIDEAMPA